MHRSYKINYLLLFKAHPSKKTMKRRTKADIKASIVLTKVVLKKNELSKDRATRDIETKAINKTAKTLFFIEI